jgi:predicted nucleic acid-binding protein
VIPTYVFDTGACVGVERRKVRATRFVRLAQAGLARIVIPLAIIPEWWRGRSDVRDDLLAAARVDASLAAAKAAGAALEGLRGVDASMTIDAVVVATAALLDGTVVTSDPDDLGRLVVRFPGVRLLTV